MLVVKWRAVSLSHDRGCRNVVRAGSGRIILNAGTLVAATNSGVSFLAWCGAALYKKARFLLRGI